MNNPRFSTRSLAAAAIVGAAYAALTLFLAPISYGPVQFRISEALTILPLFTASAVPGLFIGCFLANLLGGSVVLDVVAGSVATLIGAWAGYRLRFNRWLVPLPTVISNALIIPLVLKYGYGIDLPYLVQAGYIAVGEVLGCYVLGEILASVLKKHSGTLFSQEK